MRAAADSADGAISLAISSEEPVQRDSWFGDAWMEILDHGKGAVMMDRMQSGVALLVNHDVTQQAGIVEGAAVGADKKLRGTARFSKSLLGREIEQDVRDGIRKDVSVGYRVMEMVLEKRDKKTNVDTYRVTRWEPLEVSIVGVPADATVGVGRSADGDRGRTLPFIPRTADRPQERTMPDVAAVPAEPVVQRIEVKDPQAEAKERARVTEILSRGAEHGIHPDKIAAAVRDGMPLATFNESVFAELKERMGKPIQSGGPSVDLSEKEAKTYSYARAILAMSGFIPMERAGLERAVSDDLEKRMASAGYSRRGSGFFFPSRLATRAGLDSGGTTTGAALKFTEPGEFIDLLRNRLQVVRAGATMLTGLQGPVSMPKLTAAAIAYWMAENSGTDATASNATIGSVTLAFKTLIGYTSFSRQLLFSALSASVDAEQLVRDDLAKVHATAIDAAAVNGASSGPQGVLTNTSIGSVTLGTNGGTLTYAKIVALETAIADANADVSNMTFLTNSKVRGLLRAIPVLDTTNTAIPVWTQTADGEGNVLGYRALVSNNVPRNLTKGTATTVCSAIAFGDWSQLFIGEWAGFEIITDPFKLKAQGMIEVTSYQAVDVALRQTGAFAAIKDIL